VKSNVCLQLFVGGPAAPVAVGFQPAIRGSGPAGQSGPSDPDWEVVLRAMTSCCGLNKAKPAGAMLQFVTFQNLTLSCTRVSIRQIIFTEELVSSMQSIGLNEGRSEVLNRPGLKLQTKAA
jgi:hypothetical protein